MNILKIAAFLVLITATSSATAQEDDIEAVISGQLVALTENDFQTAYTFASPSVQAQVPTTDGFAAMVRRYFPMMLAVSEVMFIDVFSTQRSVLQRVKITSEDGLEFWFAYEMVMVNGAWRINGVTRLRAPGTMA